ncbi:MAG: hypothetical protein QXN23_06975 [Candidatus Caldarchaeum sp.]|uniref:Uncharacterized protein n=1 Tax=Caldiarchaeum subterraneum TaxID=311458 RepID=A0A7C4I3K5_CALS0|nr:hypothetical protein [Candidatus Caldarchaeales archaeon]
MRPTFAVSFESRLQRDKMAFLLKLELLVISAAALFALFLTNQSPWLRLLFTVLTCVALIVVLRDRLERAGRRLRRAVVRSVKSRGGEWFFFLPMSTPFSFNAEGYEVVAISEDLRVVRFIDWKPWKIGQQILILSDVKGRVLAVRDIRKPVRLELVKRLA